jgi:hypothetical protein
MKPISRNTMKRVLRVLGTKPMHATLLATKCGMTVNRVKEVLEAAKTLGFVEDVRKESNA